MYKDIDISVVIIEYNSINEIKRCIPAIEKSCENINFEIIVSSNSTYDKETQKKILKRFPDIRWSFNKINGGFAYGMNRGLKLAKGRYLTIANPDTTIVEGFRKMIDFMDSHRNIGAIAPQIKDEEGNIQDSCRDYVSIQELVSRQFKRIFIKTESVLNNRFDYTKIQTVDWVIGAFIMVSREAYEAAGGLDESFFMYCEDLDWCTRIRKTGFEVVYFPKMQITYKGSRSARNMNKYTKIFIKSHFIYWDRFGFFGGYPKRKNLTYSRKK